LTASQSSAGFSDVESSPGNESKEGCWPAGGLGSKEPREDKDPGEDNHEMLLADEGGGDLELLDDGIYLRLGACLRLGCGLVCRCLAAMLAQGRL